MQLGTFRVTRCATGKRFDFLLLQMASGTSERRHGGILRSHVTRYTFRDQPSTPPVALIAAEVLVLSKQRPRVIECLRGSNFSGFRNRSLLSDDRVTQLAIFSDHLSVPAYVIALVTAKTAGI